VGALAAIFEGHLTADYYGVTGNPEVGFHSTWQNPASPNPSCGAVRSFARVIGR
jgi:hypothetical protein